ncbi:hypothetical protein [Streptomyces ardesiacus]
MKARSPDGCTVSPHTSIVDRYDQVNRPHVSGRPTVDQYTRGARCFA